MPVNRSPIFGCVRIFSIVCGGEFIFRKKRHAYSQNIRAVYIFKSIKLYQNYLLSATLRDKWQIEHTRKNTASNIHRPLRISCLSIYAPFVSTASHKSGACQSARSFPRAKKIEKYSHNFDHSISPVISVTKYSHNSPDFFRLSSESARIYKCQAKREAEKQKHINKNTLKKNIENLEKIRYKKEKKQ